MKRLMKAEYKKVVGNRSTWGIVAAMIAVVTVGALQTSIVSEAGKHLWERQGYFLATLNMQLFALILGAKVVTDEFRHGTIVTAVLITPRRERFVVAKLLVVGATGLVAAALAAGALVAASWSQLGDGLQAAEWRSLVGYVVAGALWATLGGAIGFIVRHQVGAIVGAIVWTIVIDQMLNGQLGDAARYLPGEAAGALAVATSIGSMLLGGLILVAYAAGASVAGTMTMRRRELA